MEMILTQMNDAAVSMGLPGIGSLFYWMIWALIVSSIARMLGVTVESIQRGLSALLGMWPQKSQSPDLAARVDAIEKALGIVHVDPAKAAEIAALQKKLEELSGGK